MTSIINVFTIINLTLLGAILFFRKNASIADKVLGFIVFNPASTFLYNQFLYMGWVIKHPALMFFDVNLLWAPFVLWYVLLLLGEDMKMNYKKLVHLIPMFLFLIYETYVCSQDEAYIQRFVDGIFSGNYPPGLLAFNFVVLIQCIAYLSYSYIRIRRYTKSYKNKGVSEQEISIKIKWVRTFIRLLIGLNIVAIVLSVIVPMWSFVYVYCPLIYDVAFYLVIAGAIRNSTLFSAAGFQKYVAAEKENKEKYLTSSLTESQLEELHQKLMICFRDSKPHLNPELNLKNLSDELLIPQHQLSQLINQKFNKNFFDLINSYRVEEAKLRLKNMENGNLTVEGIGTECGFGSPSAFYRAFKKNTGITPGQYLKQS